MVERRGERTNLRVHRQLLFSKLGAEVEQTAVELLHLRVPLREEAPRTQVERLQISGLLRSRNGTVVKTSADLHDVRYLLLRETPRHRHVGKLEQPHRHAGRRHVVRQPERPPHLAVHAVLRQLPRHLPESHQLIRALCIFRDQPKLLLERQERLLLLLLPPVASNGHCVAASLQVRVRIEPGGYVQVPRRDHRGDARLRHLL
mmetsp:Transcript_36309/g.90375  ORF Transcript_36309/g.90375 Transcript_36309/m.90375 type:complete len:203 (+) Transcript_36309:116-724(+)